MSVYVINNVASRHDLWLILLGKELTNQLSATAHADFLEDRLEMVLHRMRLSFID